MKYRFLFCFVILSSIVKADDNYRLWLKYDRLNSEIALQYKKSLKNLLIIGNSETTNAIKSELRSAINGLIGQDLKIGNLAADGTLLVAKSNDLQRFGASVAAPINPEGFAIRHVLVKGKRMLVITSKTDLGLLYGAFALLKKMQLKEPIANLQIVDQPKIKNRILNHWDNLDRTIERGYAGFSLWNWQTLPDYIDQRYVDYARANASIGINGTVLNNVNANALILTKDWLLKVKALASVFRPYGIKVYLTARFSAPIEIGGLKTADPLNPEVVKWWTDKTNEIYQYIPDFGGFLIKANSEGQPGPQNYGRNHADGANMMAKALKPHDGIVMWRAFVYDQNVAEDRAKQAYNEFKPLDGQFDDNVIVQVKNGALDFQPREPFHPLFGALQKTNTMMEFQLTQEYLGFATHLVYLAPLFKEVLLADTYARGKGSSVGKVIDGSVYNNELTAIAGVANIGNDINWCGHPFAQANWFAFGRLAWDHEIPAEKIAKDWIQLSLKTDGATTTAIQEMMMGSRETVVNYMTPFGLAHLMGWSHHYGPGPWIKDKPRADWTSVYYHKANEKGIGFDRTPKGSNATAQYFQPVAEKYNNLERCPEEFLLWFHALPWDYKLKSGDSLWDGLVKKYHQGTAEAAAMRRKWDKLKGNVDEQTFEQVKQLLAIQEKEAIWWRDACVLYFQTFSKRPIPSNLFTPAHDLTYYQNQVFRYVPGITDGH